ncbi:hypothetical protein TeGR_g6583, partial [Tetraparma gracilis]
YGNEIQICHSFASSGAQQKGDVIASIKTGREGNLGDIAWSPDGKYIAAGFREGVSPSRYEYKLALAKYKQEKAAYDAGHHAAKKEHVEDVEMAPGVEMTATATPPPPADPGSPAPPPPPANSPAASAAPIPPVKPPEQHSKLVYYVVIYDVSGVTVDGVTQEPALADELEFTETITSVGWGPKSVKLVVTSCDIVVDDKVQSGSCRVYEKDEKNGEVKWVMKTPQRFPFWSPSRVTLEADANAFLDSMCAANGFAPDKKKGSSTFKAFGNKASKQPGDAEGVELAPLERYLQTVTGDGVDVREMQTAVYTRFGEYIQKASNSFPKEAEVLAKKISLTEPKAIAKSLALAVQQLYPMCNIAKLSPDGKLLAVGLSRETFVINTSDWGIVAHVGRPEEPENYDLDHLNAVTALDWNSDGSELGVARASQNVTCYDTKKAFQVKQWQNPVTKKWGPLTFEGTKSCKALSWSNDDQYMMVVTGSEFGDKCTVIDLENCLTPQVWTSPDGSSTGFLNTYVSAVQWSPDGNSNLAVIGITEKVEETDLEVKKNKTKSAEELEKEAQELKDATQTFFSVWSRGYNLNPQLVPLDAEPEDLVELLEEYAATLYLSSHNDTILQTLLKQRKKASFDSILAAYPMAAGAVKMEKDEDAFEKGERAEAEYETVFDVACQRRDIDAIEKLLLASARADVAGTTLPELASQSIPLICEQGLAEVLIRVFKVLPFLNTESPVTQAILDGPLHMSDLTNIDRSYNGPDHKKIGGIWNIHQ